MPEPVEDALDRPGFGAMVSASIALSYHWNGGLPCFGRPAGT